MKQSLVYEVRSLCQYKPHIIVMALVESYPLGYLLICSGLCNISHGDYSRMLHISIFAYGSAHAHVARRLPFTLLCSWGFENARRFFRLGFCEGKSRSRSANTVATLTDVQIKHWRFGSCTCRQNFSLLQTDQGTHINGPLWPSKYCNNENWQFVLLPHSHVFEFGAGICLMPSIKNREGHSFVAQIKAAYPCMF